MKTFEIHITGENSKINDEFDKLGIKNIVIELLKPNGKLHRTEYMSSFIYKTETFEECLEYVNSIVDKLKTKVTRVKIESPYYPEYVDRSIYIESHFKDEYNGTFALSRNVKSGKIMGTDRSYDKEEYPFFKMMWEKKELELCLYDTFIKEDQDWLNLYN